jgi:DNA polymerase-3 subunit epsilon
VKGCSNIAWWKKHTRALWPSSLLPELWRNAKWIDIPFLAIDLELNGLDTQTAKIVSIGWLAGKRNQIDLDSSYYLVTRASADLQQSPAIHGLTATDIAQGGHVRQAMEKLNDCKHSHIWVFHHSQLDMKIIARVAKQIGLDFSQVVTLDTLKLAQYIHHKQHPDVPATKLSLDCSRQQFGLPDFKAHQALDDAMATLELLFAQLNLLDPRGDTELRVLLHTQCIKVMLS